MGALYDGDADALRRLAADYPRFWADKRLVGAAVAQILNDEKLSDGARRKALRSEASRLCASKVAFLCIVLALMHVLFVILQFADSAGLPSYVAKAYKKEAFVNVGVAACYYLLGMRAESSPKLYIRLALAFSLVVWLRFLLFAPQVPVFPPFAVRQEGELLYGDGFSILMFIPCSMLAIMSYTLPSFRQNSPPLRPKDRRNQNRKNRRKKI
ncbi:MAG: hypothetical protein IJE97_04795 [Thermoguttaceae bacterium]|nr:hypothetical protein [Thermoguttaceae bacterium]